MNSTEKITTSQLQTTESALTSDAVGLLAAVCTFLVICLSFALAAGIAMCRQKAINRRVQRELTKQADGRAERHSTKIETDQGVIILLSLEHASDNSTKNGIQSGCYSNVTPELQNSVKAIKHEIASQHFMKNGFHHVISDEIPAKQKVTKVLSTPPLLVRGESIPFEQEATEATTITTLALPENSMKRTRSLKVEVGRAKEEVPLSPIPRQVTRFSFILGRR